MEEIMQNFLTREIDIPWMERNFEFRPTPLSKSQKLTEAERAVLAARLQETAWVDACEEAGVHISYARYILAREEALVFPRAEDLTKVFRLILQAYLEDQEPQVGLRFSPAIRWSHTLKICLEDTRVCVFYAGVVKRLLGKSSFWVTVLTQKGKSAEEIALAGFSQQTGKGFPLHRKILLSNEKEFLGDEDLREEAWEILLSAVEVMASTAHNKTYGDLWKEDLYTALYGGCFSKEAESRTSANRRHQRNTRLRSRILDVLEGAESFLLGTADIEHAKGRALVEAYPSLNTGGIERARTFLKYALRARDMGD